MNLLLLGYGSKIRKDENIKKYMPGFGHPYLKKLLNGKISNYSIYLREIWKIWDRFGIEKAQMNGYWEKDVIVKTTDPSVLATAYIRIDSILVSIANWNKDDVAVKLAIDWKKLGWHGDETIEIPAIPNFQEGKTLKLTDEITVAPIKGYLMIIKRQK